MACFDFVWLLQSCRAFLPPRLHPFVLVIASLKEPFEEERIKKPAEKNRGKATGENYSNDATQNLLATTCSWTGS